MTIGSLFSGVGGLELGLEWAGLGKTVWQVEMDDYCNKVLAKHWPDARRYKDVKEVHGAISHAKGIGDRRQQRGCRFSDQLNQSPIGSEIWGIIDNGDSCDRKGKDDRLCPNCLTPVDLICGGWPCQPFSVAGKRRGKEDDRYLWPEYLRIIRELWPSFVVAENVSGIINMELDKVLSDLENEGYYNITFPDGTRKIKPLVIPACAVDAPHRRDRVFVVAKSSKVGQSTAPNNGELERQRPCVNSDGNRRDIREHATTSRWLPEPNVGRVAHGVPYRVDRLKCLGNAVVPQVSMAIGLIIKEWIAERGKEFERLQEKLKL